VRAEAQACVEDVYQSQLSTSTGTSKHYPCRAQAPMGTVPGEKTRPNSRETHGHLAVLADDVACVANHNSRVPDGVMVSSVSLQNGAHNHHAPPPCQCLRVITGAETAGGDVGRTCYHPPCSAVRCWREAQQGVKMTKQQGSGSLSEQGTCIYVM
jgi:hypothetical protein